MNFFTSSIFSLLTIWLLHCNSFLLPKRYSMAGRSPISTVRVIKHSKLQSSSGGNPSIKSGHIDVSEELKNSFMSYAMSTILGRALPDVRDGLKPVHRRVLYAMHGLGLSPSSSHRKSARIVGEVLGKYHPHGDQSVYDALVRLAQDFVTNHPLISGHGNFGSIDNDPPAAMRYTEAKLSALAQDILFADIRENTVEWCQNFDGNEMEPAILPSRLPLLLINGASGIAVGMATNIPPHNLGEVVDGLVALIRNPNITDKELLMYIPSPDFPTGGIIYGTEGFQSFAKTGHGSIIVRAKIHVETVATNQSKLKRTALVVTELPYGTNKAALLSKIADMVNDKKIDGISDLRDESDRNGVRVVIELKKDAIPQVVENNLWKHTGLETSFSGNLLALTNDGTQPDRLSLKSVLSRFAKFRFDIIRRRTAFQLASLKKRDHLVVGLITALENIDEVVQLIKESDGIEIAKNKLTGLQFNFTEEQAESILGLTLRRINSLEGDKLAAEHRDLQESIQQLEILMTDDEKIFSVMINESLALKDKYAFPRKSAISTQQVEISTEDLVPNERSVITITNSGYLKRIPVAMFDSQSRGGRGKFSSKLSKEEENVVQFLTCHDHDSIIFTSETGIAHTVKAYKIPLGTRLSKGVPLPSLIPISGGINITAVFSLENSLVDQDLVLLTEKGYSKKTNLTDFRHINSRGLKMLSLEEGDKLKWVRKCSTGDDIVVATRNGYAIKFGESSLRRSSRQSKGVRALQLREGDSIADMDIIPKANTTKNGLVSDKYLIAVTKRGFGKKVSIGSIKSQSRLGKGAKIIKFKNSLDREDQLATTRICSNSDEIMISTQKGVVIRQPVVNISLQSKSATGVVLQSLDVDDRVLGVEVVEDGLHDQPLQLEQE